MQGRVIKSTGSWYQVQLVNGNLIDSRIKGKFRLDESKNTNPVAVGDQVLVQFEEASDAAVITEILPRQNYISRQSPKHKHARHVIASNIDQAFLIVTIAKPRTSTGFIDRFLLTAEAYHVDTHIIFNKQDILSRKELSRQNDVVKIYEELNYAIHLVSALENLHLENLKYLMKGKTTLLSGHSGVGKSTLINSICPELKIKTGKVSKQTSKGTHVTTYAEMFELPFGGYIIDTPGIKEFGILDIEPHEVGHYFKEMVVLLPDCQFNNCLHMNEPKCAVKQAVEEGRITRERYKNYMNIIDDCKSKKPF